MDHFAHLNKDQGGVKQEFDVALKRCVISVKSQRTPLHMVHVFSNVTPGRYLVQFRIRLPDSRLAFLYRNSHGDSPTPVHIKGNPDLLDQVLLCMIDILYDTNLNYGISFAKE